MHALEDKEPAAWLTQVLAAYEHEPEAFRVECLRTADLALALFKLRRAAQRSGFALLAVPAYLRSLTAIAEIPLEPLLDAFGLQVGAGGESYARSWGRLARMMGLVCDKHCGTCA